jgi:hypothetical protein
MQTFSNPIELKPSIAERHEASSGERSRDGRTPPVDSQ